MLKYAGLAMMATLLPDGGGDNKDFWLRAVGQLGVSAILALMLSWFMVSRVTTTLDRLEHSLNVRSQEHYQQTMFLRVICVNTARDEAQRAACPPLPPLDTNGRTAPESR